MRKAPNAKQISLWSINYGTHLALAAIRRHPLSIHRAILAGTEGPDHTYKLPSDIEKHLADLNEVIKADTYPYAYITLHGQKVLPKDCRLRRTKYLTNIVEQDHRFIRRMWRVTQCFRSFHTAERTIEDVEAMHMISKGQVKRLDRRDAMGQAKFVQSLMEIAV